MPIFGCASDEQFNDELADSENYSNPCYGCDPNYINACSSFKFASPDINESLRYGDEG